MGCTNGGQAVNQIPHPVEAESLHVDAQHHNINNPSTKPSKICPQPLNRVSIQGRTKIDTAPAFNRFLKEIQEQIKSNERIYKSFVNVASLHEILQQFSQRFKNHAESVDFVTLLIDFLGFCKNKKGGSALPTSFTNKYHIQLAQKWQKIRDSSFTYNKGHLKLLNYIVSAPKSGKIEFGHCFQDLNFDMSLQQTKKVAAVTKKMCKEDLRAFSYLSNYFYSSCVNLQKMDFTVSQIENKYNEVLSQLCKENPPAPPIEAKGGELGVHPNFKDENLIPKMDLDLRKFTTEIDKQLGLEAFILNRAEESIQQHARFKQIIKEVCQNNGGYHFKSGVKIKNRQQTKALTRIKEKMLSGIYKEVTLEQELSSSMKDSVLSQFIDFFSFTTQEYAEYERKMKKLFTQTDRPIPYKVSDLLRGKCVFTTVEKINKCCSDIKELIKKKESEGFRLIQIDNRLSKGNSDLVMKILFGSTIAQLQLVKDLDTADYQFSHKLYELQRSKFFTPLTQLSILNQDLSRDYFSEVRALILDNIWQKDDYNQNTTYLEALQNFKQFSKKLEVRINFLETHPSQIDFKMMTEEQKMLQKLKETAVSLQQVKKQQEWKIKIKELMNNGNFHYEMSMQTRAAQVYEQALRVFQQQKSALLNNNPSKEGKDVVLTPTEKEEVQDYLNNLMKTGLNYTLMGKYELALQKFQLKREIGKKILNITQNDNVFYASSGLAYSNLGNYALAVENYNKCLQIVERIKGKGCIESVATLNNLGIAYNAMGDYPKAFESYSKCLEIKERIKGKGSAETAVTLSNIGIVYKNMGNHSMALEACNKALEIDERKTGKGSIDTALDYRNIGLVYDSMGNYPLALENFNKCIEIRERIKGKGCYETASVFNFIGKTYQNSGNFTQALSYYELSLSLYDKHGLKYKEYQDVVNNLKSLKSKLEKK